MKLITALRRSIKNTGIKAVILNNNVYYHNPYGNDIGDFRAYIGAFEEHTLDIFFNSTREMFTDTKFKPLTKKDL